VLIPGGVLAIADEFPAERLVRLLGPLPLTRVELHERALDVRWSRAVAQRAIRLYADGWEQQVRSGDDAEKEQMRAAVLEQLCAGMEAQLAAKEYYVPFGPIRLAVARKIG
jgi:hypothetical protein